jgi:MFS family permease
VSDLPGWVPSESERTGRGPTARKAWAALGSALAGAFFVGALVSGWIGDRIIAVIIGAPIFLLASAGFLLSMGERVRVGVLPRLTLFALAAGAGFQLSQAMSYEITGPPPQDLGKAVSSVEGISGGIVLVLAILVGLYLSFREFPLVAHPAAASPETDPSGSSVP